MELDKVKELVQLMVDNNLSSICIRDGDDEITLSRTHGNGVAHGVGELPPQLTAVSPQAATMAAAIPPGQPVGDAGAGGGRTAETENHATIESPMVGTFYSSPDPEAQPFVEVGDRVTASTVVCIIEAMKVFNEIRAEVSGTIEKVLATNQQAVEYGQPMFLVRPD